jgi:ABC-2 type transport system permease protein
MGSVVREILTKSGKVLAAFIAAPAVLVFLIVLMLMGGVRGLPLAVVNQDSGVDMPFMGHVSIPDQFLKSLDAKAYKVITLSNEAEGVALVKKGKAYGVLVFPPDLSKEMLIKADDPSYEVQGKIKLRTDQSRTTAAALLQLGIMNGFMKLATAQGGKSPMPLDTSDPVFGKDLQLPDFLIPGILILLSFLLTLVGTAVLGGQAYRQSAARVPAKISGVFTVFLAASAVQLGLLFAAAAPLLGLHFLGNAGFVLLALLLFLIAESAIGSLFAVISGGPEYAPLAAVIGVLPILFGNVLLPIELLPYWLRPLKFLMIPYYGADAFRNVTLRVLPLRESAADLIVLAGFAVLFLSVAFAVAGRKPKTENKQ